MPWPTHVRTDELVSALRLFEDGGDLAHPDKIRACLSGTSALPWDTAPDISGLCRLVGLPRAAQLEGAKAFMLATGLSARVVRRTVVSKPGMPATSCTLLPPSTASYVATLPVLHVWLCARLAQYRIGCCILSHRIALHHNT